jgi:transcriptional regulator
VYLPAHFEESRVDVLHELIHAHPLGALVTLAPGGLDANHIPFEVDPEPAPFGTLRGHVARANPVWREFSRETDALVIFQGPGTYISPALYPTKQETGRVVPTWNYAVVHAHGPLRVIDDKAWLRDFVTKLTNRHEAARRDPWHVTDAPAEYIDTMLGAIIGIEIPMSRLVGKWKMSQNRPAQDRAGVVDGLLQDGAHSDVAVADMVRRSNSGATS